MPGSHQSGKRKGSVKRNRNRAGRLFCVIALVRKLAAVCWRVMAMGMDYVEHSLAHYEAKVMESKQRALRRLAAQLGQQLVPNGIVAPS